jgi:hypothetical protein
LQVITREVVEKWKQDIEKQKQDNDAAKKIIDHKTRIEDQSPDRCDLLAANPNDGAKPANVDGVAYDLLKVQSVDAIRSCEIAAAKYPDQLRFQYQLARALGTTGNKANLQRAFEIHKRLVDLQYPAAFDNLGWLYITLFPSTSANLPAIALFRRGIQLGDSDSMVSLVEMINSGLTTPQNQSETPIALITRAAQLGNQQAQNELPNIQTQQQTKELMKGIVEGLIQRIGH